MGNGFLLIVAGLLLFYLVLSDKFKCIEGFAGCVTGINNTTAPTVAPTVTSPIPQTATPTIAYGLPNLSANINWNYGF